MENISHIGSLWTMTDFKLEDGSQIRLKVGLKTICTSANFHTFYVIHVFKKGFKCRNWIYQFEAENHLDKRILNEISEEQLYHAYYNHWQKINPIRFFNNGQINGEFVNFKVNEKFQDKHFAY